MLTADEVFLRPAIGPDGHEGVGHFADAEAFARFSRAYLTGLAQLPEPDDLLAQETSFGPVRGYRFGTRGGTPVVLLAGRQSCTPLWRANIAPLLEHTDVWCLDSVGEPGASTQEAPLRTALDQATWLAEALAGIPSPKVHLLGVSIGGWLAAQCAVHRPHRLASVTLLDPAMTFTRISPKMVLVSLGSVLPGMPDGLRHRLLGWVSGGATSSEDVPEGRLIASGMRDFRARVPAPSRLTPAEVRAIDVPVLTIIAGSSIAHSPQAAAAGARAVPGATVEVWAGASHAINGEQPDRIAHRMHQFTSTIDS